MQTLQELGSEIATLHKAAGLTQAELAAQAGITKDTLSRFERGALAEFGSRKLLAVLAALGMEVEFRGKDKGGTLDELRRERGQA